MHQKAQLVATIINEPDLLIVDEPFQGLDPVNARDAQGAAARAARPWRGRDHEHARHGDAQTLCDRIVLIDKGHAAAVRHASATYARAFSDGAVEVVGKDLPTDTDGTAQRSHATAYDGSVRYLLRDGADGPGPVPRAGRDTGAQVERFAVEAPNLAEIFVRAVAGDRAARMRGGMSSPRLRAALWSTLVARAATTCAPSAGAASWQGRCCCRLRHGLHALPSRRL